jgi:hypothetical protein
VNTKEDFTGLLEEDSKFRELIRHIEKQKEENKGPVKMIIFATFRGTLEYLKSALEKKGYSVRCIHGGVPMKDRPGIIDAFREKPEVNILLSSRVGGEGLDFQFAHVMFNYDLPWNPMEVEQRIGRLDRIGQEAKVIKIYHLFLKDTIEESILLRLYQRVNLFERSIGELEPILGDVVKAVEESILSSMLHRDSEEENAARIERVLEIRKKELEDIDKDSEKFIGTDSFFAEEVQRIRNNRFYITADQMRLFFEDFLRRYDAASCWEYDDSTCIGKFSPGEEFKDYRQRYYRNERLHRSSSILARRHLEITFDAEVAYRHPNVEFINVLHPLTHLILDVYENADRNGRQPFDKAFHILLKKDEEYPFSSDFYFFQIDRINIEGIRDSKRMELAAISDEGELLPREIEDKLFAYLMERGRNPLKPLPRFNRDDPDGQIISQRLNSLKEILWDRRCQLEKELQKSNTSLLHGRKTAFDTMYRRKIEQLKEQIQRRTEKGEDEKSLRMPKGKLRRIEEAYEEKLQELEQKSNLEVHSETVCCGILEICAY